MLCQYLLVHLGTGLPLNKDVCHEKRPRNLRPSVRLLDRKHHQFLIAQLLLWFLTSINSYPHLLVRLNTHTHTHGLSQHRRLTSWPLKPNMWWAWLQIHCKEHVYMFGALVWLTELMHVNHAKWHKNRPTHQVDVMVKDDAVHRLGQTCTCSRKQIRRCNVKTGRVGVCGAVKST